MTKLEDADTLAKILKLNSDRFGNQIGIRDKDLGIWQSYDWKEYYSRVKYFSLGLMNLGLKRGDRVSIIGDNEPQWYWASLATQAAGGIVVAMFTDAVFDEIKHILTDSDAKFVICRDQEQVDKILAIKDELPLVQGIIWWYHKGMSGYKEPFIFSFDEVEQRGRKHEQDHPDIFDEVLSQGKGEDVCNIYYTSGTSGLPKGGLCTYKNLMHSTHGVLFLTSLTQNDDIVSFLPPAWIGDAFFGTIPHLLTGATLNTIEAPETVFENIKEIGPALILGGPRQWEGWASRVQAWIAGAGGTERFLYNLLLPIGYKVAEYRLQNKRTNPFWKALNLIADGVLFRPIRDTLGLEHVKFGLNGGAAVSPETLRFLHALGIRVRQMYGSTEGGLMAGHRTDDYKLGTVGTLLPGVELRITEGGEIISRSASSFLGYHKKPELTGEKLRDGWFYTGDGGHIDDEGYLVFMDRVEELGDLRDGTRYAPQYIESTLRFNPYIKDCMAIGQDRDYVTVIITIDYDNVSKWAERHTLPFTTYTDLSQKPEVAEKLILPAVKKTNSLLPLPSRIKKFVSLHKEFDPDEAELTRTRKLKRGALEKRYGELIDTLYTNLTECAVETSIAYQDGRKGSMRVTIPIYWVQD